MDAEDTPLLVPSSPPMACRYESFVAEGSSITYHSADADRCGRQTPDPTKPSGYLKDDTRGLQNALYEQHCHSPSVSASTVDTLARKKLIIASMLCLLFMIVEVVGGLLANSLAIATDAAHLLTDFASFMISLFALWLSGRAPTKHMSFGWHRAEVIGALTSVLLIWLVTGVLVFMAVQRIVNEDYDINATVMLITAGLGIVVNIIMGVSLQAGGVPHGHSHAPPTVSPTCRDIISSIEEARSDATSAASRGTRNLNVRAALIHVIGDFLQSLGVFTAALIIFFKPEYRIADPLCTFLFSALVLMSTVAILREGLTVLMEGKPHNIDFLSVLQLLAQEPGVHQVHNLRIWALSADKIALSAHIAIQPREDSMRILQNCTRLIRSHYDIFEMTLQVEEYNEGMADCSKCNDLQD